MSKEKGTFKVKEDPDQFGVYECEAWTDKENPYTVDVLNLNGNGTCTCMDFQTRCYKHWKANGKKHVPYGTKSRPNKDRTECKHIMICGGKFDRKMREIYSAEYRGDEL